MLLLFSSLLVFTLLAGTRRDLTGRRSRMGVLPTDIASYDHTLVAAWTIYHIDCARAQFAGDVRHSL